MNRIPSLLFSALCFSLLLLFVACRPEGQDTPKAEGLVYNILDYGARGDSTTLNTLAIQSAIESAAEAGGGRVVVPPGNFITGTLFLCSNTELYIQAGGHILGSAHIEDYAALSWGHNKDRQPYHLIVIDSARHVRIAGMGSIDGRGENFWKNPHVDPEKPQWILAKDKKVSPLIEITASENVQVEDITVRTGGGWNIHCFNSRRIKVQGVHIDNNLFSPNSDGIDITGCEDVMISDCYIRTCDDGVCVKTTPKSKACRRVTVTNCVIQTSCVALKAGFTESYHDMEDITFSNCVVDKTHRPIGLYTRNGGSIRRVNISNIVANGNAPIVLPLPIHLMSESQQEGQQAGNIEDVQINNFTYTGPGRIMLTSADGGRLKNISLRNLQMSYPWIEDPSPYVKGKNSSQFPKEAKNPGALAAQAVIVADGIDQLTVEGLQTSWPEPGALLPEDWQHPQKVENGVLEPQRINYGKAHACRLSLLWARDVQGGYWRNPLAEPSKPGTPRYQLNKGVNVMGL